MPRLTAKTERGLLDNWKLDGARNGRPRVTTTRQDRVIVCKHQREPFLPAHFAFLLDISIELPHLRQIRMTCDIARYRSNTPVGYRIQTEGTVGQVMHSKKVRDTGTGSATDNVISLWINKDYVMLCYQNRRNSSTADIQQNGT